MRRPIDSQKWCYGDLTGGGAFCTTPSGDIYVASPVREDGSIALLKSQDKGNTWGQVWVYQLYPGGVTPTTVSEPQVAYNPVGNVLNMVYHKDNGNSADLLLFTYNLDTLFLMGPTTVITAQKFKPSYCVVWDGDAGEISVIAVAIDPTAPAALTGKWGIVEIVFNPAHVPMRTNILKSELMSSRVTYGALQALYFGGKVELYYNQRPKVYQFTQKACGIWKMDRPSGTSLWEPATLLHNYEAEFSDDRMTVVPVGNSRYLTYVYYTKEILPGAASLVAKLSYQMLLGHNESGVWDFMPVALPEEATDPTLSIANTAPTPVITLAYLKKRAQSSSDGTMVLSRWTPSTRSITPLPDPKVVVSYLRGGLTYFSDATEWAFVGVSPTKTIAWYISQLNLPPVATLAPVTATIFREIPLTLSAVGTTDPDMDDIRYTWSVVEADTTFPDDVVLTSRGQEVDVLVKNSWGPSAGQVKVRVSVSDYSGDSQLHSVNLDAVLTVNYNPPPFINWTADPVIVPRHTSHLLVPVIYAPMGDEHFTYKWEQISGPPCKVGPTDSTTLSVDLSQARVLGDTYSFRFTVTDGVNAPVESTIQVEVSPIKLAPSVLDTNFVSRSVWFVDSEGE